MMQEVFVGVDVSKDWLDTFHPRDGANQIDNAPMALRVFAKRCAKQNVWVIFEASGGYERLLRAALEAEKVRFTRVNPRQARDLARAMGVNGKTDRVDAHMLSEFGARLRPAQTEPLAAARSALKAQATRRRQLVEMRKRESTRLQQTANAEARADIRSHIEMLKRRIEKFNDRMVALIAADRELADIDRRLRTVPGVGPVVAATLIADLPELGRLDRRRIAALAGLAPVARDSGKRLGRRTIGGGRPIVRGMLYIAALHASRRCAVFRTFRSRLTASGKPTKVILIATARKLLGVLNAMLANATDYRMPAEV